VFDVAGRARSTPALSHYFADYLVTRGVAFREAHDSRPPVRVATERGVGPQLPLAELRRIRLQRRRELADLARGRSSRRGRARPPARVDFDRTRAIRPTRPSDEPNASGRFARSRGCSVRLLIRRPTAKKSCEDRRRGRHAVYVYSRGAPSAAPRVDSTEGIPIAPRG
jgi:hypothetical protein